VTHYNDLLEPRAKATDHEDVNLQQVSNTDVTPEKVAELGTRLPGFQIPAFWCI